MLSNLTCQKFMNYKVRAARPSCAFINLPYKKVNQCPEIRIQSEDKPVSEFLNEFPLQMVNTKPL